MTRYAIVFATAVSLMGRSEAGAQFARGDTARYVVRFSAGDSMTAEVSAEIVTTGRLTVRQGAADHLPLGWSTFVRDLHVTRTLDGAGIQPTPDSARGWTVLVPGESRVALRYRVDLSYAHAPWPPGNEQAGEWENGALYTVTKPFFIMGDSAAPAIVRFVLPSGWRVATPWRPLSGAPNSYSIASGSDLVDNSFVVGTFSALAVHSGPFDFTIALLGPMRRDSAIVRRTIPAVAEQYARIFATMQPTTYLMTLFYGSEDDGESFRRSSAFRTRDRVTAGNTILWANTLAHELFHYWNGGMIDGSDEIEKQWFMEGFTEYYANRALLRARAITQADYLKKAEVMSGLYTYFRTQPMFDTVSVLKAGQRKTRYRFGLYNGGWSMAFALDQEVQDATHGCHSLDDVFRSLFKSFGATGQRYAEADIERAVTEVAERDESPFFKRYISGLELLPMDSVLAKVGLTASFISYAGEAYIETSPSATAAQRARWRTLTTGASSCSS